VSTLLARVEALGEARSSDSALGGVFVLVASLELALVDTGEGGLVAISRSARDTAEMLDFLQFTLLFAHLLRRIIASWLTRLLMLSDDTASKRLGGADARTGAGVAADMELVVFNAKAHFGLVGSGLEHVTGLVFGTRVFSAGVDADCLLVVGIWLALEEIVRRGGSNSGVLCGSEGGLGGTRELDVGAEGHALALGAVAFLADAALSQLALDIEARMNTLVLIRALGVGHTAIAGLLVSANIDSNTVIADVSDRIFSERELLGRHADAPLILLELHALTDVSALGSAV